MSNIFKDSVDPHYFQVTYKQLDVLPTLERSGMLLLMVLLGAVQRKGKPSFVLTTAYLVERTKLTRKALLAAKTQLQDAALVQIEPAKGKGAWRFTFPVTYRHIDLETLTTDELRAYYVPHLYDVVEHDSGIVSTCPFHHKKKQFTLKLKEDADKRIGTWSCFCHGQQSGRVIEFEQRISGVDEKQAHCKVTDFFTMLRSVSLPVPKSSANVDVPATRNTRPRQPYRPKKEETAA